LQRSCIAAGGDFEYPCPVAMMKRNMIIKLSKNILGRVKPQTKADNEL
jgi:hypothetical protein